MEWVRLERGNDWGHEYFSMPGEARRGPGRACDVKYGLQIPDGWELRVRWPSGEVEWVLVKSQMKHAEVFDMGNTRHVDYKLAGIAFDYKGTAHWVPLDAVEIDASFVSGLRQRPDQE
jgi:hypothetical protein